MRFAIVLINEHDDDDDRTLRRQYFMVELRGRVRHSKRRMEDIEDWTGLSEAKCVKRA